MTREWQLLIAGCSIGIMLGGIIATVSAPGKTPGEPLTFDSREINQAIPANAIPAGQYQHRPDYGDYDKFTKENK